MAEAHATPKTRTVPTALLSMDLEDWYHLEYFKGARGNGYSMLDGLERFRSLLADERVPATFFVLGELVPRLSSTLRALSAEGHEIASHGPDHVLLHSMSPDDFAATLRVDKARVEDLVGHRITGYRAPCFSIDQRKLERLAELGFLYDSSWIRFSAHPTYGSMQLDHWPEIFPGVRRAPGSDFLEYEVSTAQLAGRSIPVAGGAYFRIFPWLLTRALLQPLLARGGTYVFYTHPFECSNTHLRAYPQGTSRLTRWRFETGRSQTLPRLRALISMLRRAGFEFSTCSGLHSVLTR